MQMGKLGWDMRYLKNGTLKNVAVHDKPCEAQCVR